MSLHHIRKIVFLPSGSEHFLAPADGVASTTSSGEEPQLPTDASELALATCGYENIRLWRLRRSKLLSCSLPLQHHEGDMMLDIAIGGNCGAGRGFLASANDSGDASTPATGVVVDDRRSRMLVSSSSGKVFQVTLQPSAHLDVTTL